MSTFTYRFRKDGTAAEYRDGTYLGSYVVVGVRPVPRGAYVALARPPEARIHARVSGPDVRRAKLCLDAARARPDFALCLALFDGVPVGKDGG